MDYKDYYKIMGLSRDATDKDIKLAYRRLARKYHPDLNKEDGAEAKFKELGEAYDVLKNAEKRKTYDQYGRDWELNQKAQAAQQQSRSHTWTGGADAGNQQYTRDFFESLFGGAPFHEQTVSGADLRGSITINLDEAYFGTVKELQLPAENGTGPQTIRVKIPAGVKSGQQLRLAGQGASSIPGGEKGDLYLTININKHPIYDVMGNDIYITLPIAPWEAALGATVVVPTLGGNVDLKIPPGSQGGQKMRLKKRGLRNGDTPGDQYILLKIVIPQPTTEANRALYTEMEKEMPFNPREKMGV